jgi:hypothetical protein
MAADRIDWLHDLGGHGPGGDQHGDLPGSTLRGHRGGALVSLGGRVGSRKTDRDLALYQEGE